MKLPIRNRTATTMTLFVEPWCSQFEIPSEGEAIVILADGETYSLDIHPENWVTIWNEGQTEAVVEVISKEQNAVVDALSFATVWLHQYGSPGRVAAEDLDRAINCEEGILGYFRARIAAYQAFREGFRTKAAEVNPHTGDLQKWRGSEGLQGAYQAGGVAAYWNHRTRLKPSLVELGEAPFDTDMARRKFADADAMIG